MVEKRKQAVNFFRKDNVPKQDPVLPENLFCVLVLTSSPCLVTCLDFELRNLSLILFLVDKLLKPDDKSTSRILKK